LRGGLALHARRLATADALGFGIHAYQRKAKGQNNGQ
jgi:hypothetical protein